jgi:hypothetical protein
MEIIRHLRRPQPLPGSMKIVRRRDIAQPELAALMRVCSVSATAAWVERKGAEDDKRCVGLRTMR